jgi:hypothetical protein
MERVPASSPTSRDVAAAANPEVDDQPRETVEDHDVDPAIKNADRPKGLDKPDGELESLNDNLQRVEKRTTM